MVNIMRLFFLFFITFSIIISAQNNVTFLSNLNPHPAAGYANIWGYVAPNGTEYALLGVGTGTSIISLADPSNPVECAFIPAPQSLWRELKVWSHYAYVATDATGNGLQIIDLAPLPDTAILVNTLNTYFNDCHDLLIDNGYCYTVGGDGIGGLRILNLADPVNPVQTAYYTASGYIHDIYIWNDTVIASCGSSQQYHLINVTNKSNPQFISASQTLPGIYAHSGWMTENKRYFFATEEFNVRDMTVWDLQDRTSWDLIIPSWGLNNNSVIHNLYIKGNFAHVSYYTSGYLVLDISNPTNPQIAGQYDTYPANNNSDYDGAWGVYPYLPSGNIIVSDMSTGLYVLHFDGEVQTFQLNVNVFDGWNMVSVPGTNPDGMGVANWWPGRVGDVYKYNAGYQTITTATPGVGYWMKNNGAQTYNTGDEWPAGGLQVVAHTPLTGAIGWNMIGGYELIVTAANVSTNPPGLQSGPIYKYSGGYSAATTLDPGFGYWIKLTGSGQIIIPETMSKESKPVEYFPGNWGRIVITDAAGMSYTLYAVNGQVDLSQYELPPAPPAGMYDFRYSSGRIAEDLSSSVKTIEMSGVVYPLTVRVEGMDIRLMDQTGKTLNQNLKSGEEIVISDATIQKLMVSSQLVPTVYSLEQNYPNPFNPSTMIEFSLPEMANVKLSIYNALGEKVAELVNTSLQAGKYQYNWNVTQSGIATGMYIYELRTDNFVSVKKMLLIR